jgi:hypothetical protein
MHYYALPKKKIFLKRSWRAGGVAQVVEHLPRGIFLRFRNSVLD